MWDQEPFDFPRRARLFMKGDFKYVVLDLLKQKPSYGYEIIRRLEEFFHGHYAPSAGVVYPTLQMLEDLGYVTAAQQDGKKVYTITEQGLGFLEEREAAANETRERMHAWWGHSNKEEFRDMAHELRELARLARHHARGLDEAKLHCIREVVSRACHEIEAILEGSGDKKEAES